MRKLDTTAFARQHRLAWLWALVLLSGAGLLAFGLVSLWTRARDAEQIVEAELRKAAQATARAVREALLDPALTGSVPREQLFSIGPGGLVVPPEVGWLDAPPPPPPDSSREREAWRLELVRKDRAAARALLANDPQCTLAAAWAAHRDGDDATRDSLLARAEPLGSWLVLHAHARQPLPEWSERVLRLSEPAHAEAVLARIAEIDERRDVTALREAIRESERWRANLRKVRAAGGAAALSVPRPVGDDLLVTHPRDAEARVCGGIVLPLCETLARLRRVATPPWSGTVEIGASPGDDAIVAIAGAVHVVPDAAPRATGPFGLGALLLVLAASFAGGSLLAFRALRREARAMAARAEFLTSVTHELKTPLAGIRVVAEMLEQGCVDGATKRGEYHEMLVSESARLTALIENVLDLGRIERGERGYDRRPHELGTLVREAGALFVPIARRDGLVLDVGTDAEAVVDVDRGAFVQALLNMLDNARKYAGAGGRIVLRQAGQRITVRDFGPGVPAEERERIFAKFVRGKAQRDGSVPGLGLGLHLAREIVRAHGGELSCAAAADGPGAVFVVDLQAAVPR